jgi:hypothetical protein
MALTDKVSLAAIAPSLCPATVSRATRCSWMVNLVASSRPRRRPPAAASSSRTCSAGQPAWLASAIAQASVKEDVSGRQLSASRAGDSEMVESGFPAGKAGQCGGPETRRPVRPWATDRVARDRAYSPSS